MSDTVSLDELSHAVRSGELVFHYQPRVSMVLGSICGAEALIRWVRPDGRLIPPGAFIPLAERSGFISEITLAMVPKLLADLTILGDVDAGLSISFNASARDFGDDRLVRTLHAAVEHALFRPETVEVELTESAVLGGGGEVVRRLELLRETGLKLAMDDFGTGFSSIDTLAKLPFTTLKIDQGVVGRMVSSSKDATIVDSSIGLGHALDLEVIAEGVETEQAYARLQSAGCMMAQGYWMSRPLPLDGFLGLLRAGRRWPAEPIGLIHTAILDHVAWRKALVDLVLLSNGAPGSSGVPASARRIALEPTDCRLGQWYYGPARARAGHQAFDALEAPHARLHALGKELYGRALAGAPQAELLPLMRELSAASIWIITALQDLENELLARRTELPAERAARPQDADA